MAPFEEAAAEELEKLCVNFMNEVFSKQPKNLDLRFHEPSDLFTSNGVRSFVHSYSKGQLEFGEGSENENREGESHRTHSMPINKNERSSPGYKS